MKTSLATMLSVTGVLAAGALAFAVNTSVLDHAVTTSEAAPALQADVVSPADFTPSGVTASAATTQVPPAAAAPAVTAEVAAAVAAQSTYNIDGVAAITLALSDNSLSVVSVAPAGGYTAAATAVSASRIEVVFTKSNSVMKFSAQVLDGRIVTSVVAEQPRVSSTAPAKYNDDDHDDEHEENENDEREGDDD